MSEAFFGFAAACAVAIALLIAAAAGYELQHNSITKDCERYGIFYAKDQPYTCKKVTP